MRLNDQVVQVRPVISRELHHKIEATVPKGMTFSEHIAQLLTTALIAQENTYDHDRHIPA